MISLLTHGWICYSKISVVNKYIMPYNLEIKTLNTIDLDIKEKENITLNLSNILDKQVNLKLNDNQINIKNNLDNQINIEE